VIEAADDFDLIAPVTTSIVAFRHLPAASEAGRAEALNRALPAAVQRRGRAFVTGTTIAGAAALRACVLNPATTEADLAVLLDEIRAAAAVIAP
jgi:glutamate/tyrosine decarboxylase-like PLP-dependent enzyme